MGMPIFIRFLAVQYFVWRLCRAASFQALDPSSSLYTFGPGWTKNATGQYATITGSVLFSFKGASFSVPGDLNPGVSVTLYVDGHLQGIHANGSVPETVLSYGDHQIVLEARALSSSPYVFGGIAFPVQNGTNLNITEYVPRTYGIAASIVPSDAITLDNADSCMLYSQGDLSHWDKSDVTNDWGSYNGSLAVSAMDSDWSNMQIYFQGTGIWLFFSQITTLNTTAPLVEVIIYSESSKSGTPEVVDTISLSSFGVSDIALRQQMLWSRTNLTDGLYNLRLFVHRWYSNQPVKRVALDFARVRGKTRDCRLYNPDQMYTRNVTDWSVMKIVGMILGGLLLPALFFICFRCLRYMKTRKLRPHGMPPFDMKESLGEPGVARENFQISDDGSSFMSVMTHKYGAGPQVLPLTNDDAPTQASALDVKIIPFHSDSLDTNHQQQLSRVEPQHKIKHPLNHSRLSDPNAVLGVAGGGRAVTSAVSETNTDPGSDIFSLSSPPQTLRRSAVLPGSLAEGTPLGDSVVVQHQTDWSPPPPSYITQLHDLAPGPRPGERMRLLTQEDLSRLVDRVIMLRRREMRLAIVGAEGQAEEESHEDPVEILARRIADTDTSSDSIRVSTERQK